MGVSQEQIIKGVLRYTREKVVPSVDGSAKLILSMGLGIVEAKPNKLNAIFEHPLIKNDDGQYDIDLIETVLCKTAEDFGGFTITIPPIKFIAPEESILKFGADDIKQIISLIREVGNGY